MAQIREAGRAVLMVTPSLEAQFQEIIYFHENRYSWALSHIFDLEEQLSEVRESIRRLIEGNPQEWDT
jgi:hypothetical protein